MFPRLGIGITYANIPETNFQELDPDEQSDKAVSTNDDFPEDFYRQGLHLELVLALVKNIRITPHWQLSSSISLSYLPALEEREEDQQDDPQEDVDLKTCTVSMALSYTPNS